ncbi:MAG: hypothetical protein NT153_11190 [Bacteroidetes bacterium]|nr:hypothetical protein [Bacteroidota bacterium]
MNIVNRFFLYLVLLPSKLYQKMGINTVQLASILSIKLMMDDRRPNTMHQANKRKEAKPISAATIGTMFVSAAMGSFFLISFFVGSEMLTRFTIYFSFFIFVLSSTLIADFTSVLIDIRDNIIILPKPVTDKTFVIARLLHILIHISKLVVPMTLPAFILLGIRNGLLALPPFLLMVIAATLFTIFLINALYLIILKITTPEKFKVIISYFQIFFAILFYGGYQIVPRLIGKAVLDNYSINTASYAFLIPPYWFAGGWEFLHSFQFSATLISCFLLSIFVPFASIYIVIKYFAPYFMISGSDGESMPAIVSEIKQPRPTNSFINTIANLLTDAGAEKMAFLHTWKMTARSRDFKLRVYPSFGYMLVYFFMIFLRDKRPALNSIKQNSNTEKVIFISIIYFSSLILITAINQLKDSDKYKAAWIYFTTPIEKPGKIISGALKSLLVKFYLPIIALTFFGAILVEGPRVIPNLFLGLCNQLLIIFLIGYASIRNLPFSQAPNLAKTSFMRGLLTLLIPGTIAFLHYSIYTFMPVVIILSILSCIASWLVMDALKNKGWEIITELKEGY